MCLLKILSSDTYFPADRCYGYPPWFWTLVSDTDPKVKQLSLLAHHCHLVVIIRNEHTFWPQWPAEKGREEMCLSHNITKRKGILRPWQGHEVSHCTKFLLHWFMYSQNQKIVDSTAIDLGNLFPRSSVQLKKIWNGKHWK